MSSDDMVPTTPSTPEAPPSTARTPREFERFLRDHGYSKAAARGITTRGFKTRDLDAAEAEAEEAELLAALGALRAALGGPTEGGAFAR